MWSNAVLVANESDEQSAIEVRDNNGFKGIFAKEAVAENSVVFYLKGAISTTPTKYTIQLGHRRHLNFPTTRRIDDELDYCWQYLNHSCEPNGYMDTVEMTFRALRDIAPGEEITFNYLTTESEMAEPFNCICGSASCFEFIQGRNFLSHAQSERLSRTMGEDNVVTLFMPALHKVNYNPGSRRVNS